MTDHQLIAMFQYPDWVHPRNRGEGWEQGNCSTLLEVCNNNYATLSFLLEEDWEMFKYQTSFDKMAKVLHQISNVWTDEELHELENEELEHFYTDMFIRWTSLDLGSVFFNVVEFLKIYNTLKKTGNAEG